LKKPVISPKIQGNALERINSLQLEHLIRAAGSIADDNEIIKRIEMLNIDASQKAGILDRLTSDFKRGFR